MVYRLLLPELEEELLEELPELEPLDREGGELLTPELPDEPLDGDVLTLEGVLLWGAREGAA